MRPALSRSSFRAVENVDPNEAGIAAARRRAVEAFGLVGLGGAHLFSIELSIHEALVNALVHGVGENGATQIRLSYEVAGGRVGVVVEDNGDGRKTQAGDRDHSESGGRGLFLIRAFTSRARLEGRVNSMELDLDTETPPSSDRCQMNLEILRGVVC
jgi:anti-sigma regulatory factor (Ser/Thr protein kinase)